VLRHTRTIKFNSTILVEYMDGQTRAVRKDTLSDSDAHCVQLLRLAFVQRKAPIPHRHLQLTPVIRAGGW